MGKFVKTSNTLVYYNNSASPIIAGTVVTFNSGALAGVAASYIAPYSSGIAWLDGIWELPTAASFSCTQGAPAYWSGTAVVTSVPSGSTYPKLGVFAETLSSSTAGAAQVVLNVAGITVAGT